MNRQTQASLQAYHSFRCPSITEEEVSIRSEDDLMEAYRLGLFNEPWIVLGHGTNTLFLPRVSERVFLMQFEGFEHEILNDDQIHVTVGAGVEWDDLVEWSISQGYGGIEAMIRIPGTCGAAPVQNIGAYGQELDHVLHGVRAFDTQKGVFHDFTPDECGFSYRDSLFKRPEGRHWIITSISLRLHGASYQIRPTYPSLVASLNEAGISNPTLKDVGQHVAAIRASKLPNPSSQPNAGSFFKNPVLRGEQASRFMAQFPEAPWFELEVGMSIPGVETEDDGTRDASSHAIKVPAGWLIEHVGLKGEWNGRVGVWPKQALVLYHQGEATGVDILELASRIQDKVRQTFGVELEQEVRVYGVE
ncbi:MAG: UDP-N-acetylmuramate dehydrogenase [Rhodothermaeota bacterium MED-G64]|nr:MAG: UDP-N-acetylmuramate dehydrogenase [Rhodothermaeota bacterium MED-G64]